MVGKGGFGDMFPLFALAAELQARGHAVSIAAEAHHAPACATIGVALLPLDRAAERPATRWALLDTLSPVRLEAEVDTLLPHGAEADLIVGNQLAYCGAIVRKLTSKPWVLCAASPLTIPSVSDPPLWPYLRHLQTFSRSLGFRQAACLGLARAATRALMQPQLRLQERLGIEHDAHPRFEGMYSEQLNLLATSPALVAQHADRPAGTLVTGFSWFEPAFLGDAGQFEELARFASAGPAPLVFAPGGSKRTHPGIFFERSVDACRKSGQRAIIVAAKKFHGLFKPDPDILVTGYFPYSRLFGLASAVVHSGGIGTLGWALRLGLPSLLVPSDWDQYDNADRAERRGLAKVLPIERYTPTRIAGALDALLTDEGLRTRLSQMAPLVAAENGQVVASDAIEALLRGRCSP
jgi:UDP:flavonoid glycosyltransferase YjiC (YdhE family)